IRCAAQMMEYRALITDYLTRDIPLETITSRRVLGAKYAAQLLSGEITPDALRRAGEIAERMVALEPDNPDVTAKLAETLYHTLPASESRDELLKRLDRALD